jgi:hypothetical protein
MIARLYHVGSSPETAPVIEASFQRLIGLMEPLLSTCPYLFGGTPSLADFGLSGQFAQLLSDPTPGAMIRAQAPNLVRWIARMDNPRVEGAFVDFSAVRAGLLDLVRSEVAETYLVWMAANAAAVAADASAVSAELAGSAFSQKPQRYAAKALAEIRRKRALLVGNDTLEEFLREAGCDAILAPPASVARGESAGDNESDDDESGDEDES